MNNTTAINFNRHASRHPHETATDITWEELVLREPNLQSLLDACECITREHDPCYCATRIWEDVFEPVLATLVGEDAEQNDPVLQSNEAYVFAWRRCRNALPDCRACNCP